MKLNGHNLSTQPAGTRVCICVWVCVFVCGCVWVGVCVCGCECVSVCVWVYVCMFVFVFVYLCVCVCSLLNPFTLYSWMSPFCASAGGGCQETLMLELLPRLSVDTVTA